LACFLSESRENLESAGRCFLQLEQTPDSSEVLNDLFRAIHTMKGSSGLFDIPPFTKTVHAAEDLMDQVRSGEVILSAEHIDLLLEVMDQISLWLDELELQGCLASNALDVGQGLSAELRAIYRSESEQESALEPEPELLVAAVTPTAVSQEALAEAPTWLQRVDDGERMALFEALQTSDERLIALEYRPEAGCFFSGDDPLHMVRHIPDLRWFAVVSESDWPSSEEWDLYQCNLRFYALSLASETELQHYFRYQIEQVSFTALQPSQLVFAEGVWGDEEPFELFLQQAPEWVMKQDGSRLAALIRPLLELSGAELQQTSVLRWLRLLLQHDCQDQELFRSLLEVMTEGVLLWPEQDEAVAVEVSAEHRQAAQQALQTQQKILTMPCGEGAMQGRIASVSMVMSNMMQLLGMSVEPLLAARDAARQSDSLDPLSQLLQGLNFIAVAEEDADVAEPVAEPEPPEVSEAPASSEPAPLALVPPAVERRKSERRVGGRRQEPEIPAIKTLKVDQQRIDSLMDLVGELVVAKNALPFLAKRAEEHFGVRQLAKEIKSQYTVINRLSEELQGAMMQIRMVPISTVFQRFPRLVRDLSRKLDKQVELKLEGEETEADKNVVENLADPLIHLVRNSLDHGLESAAERLKAGKTANGTITLRAIGQDDQVVIEICDDGRGIDPEKIKRKAYQNGLLDEQRLESISDHEALQLIFAAGLSTAETVSDLSGRGVGMDVVRSVIQQAGGTVEVSSELGQGSKVRLTLPLSMAVSRVMMIEVAGQSYGVSMENIIETVRIPRSAVQRIKQSEALVLRERLIPLFSLRTLLGLAPMEQQPEEIAVLVMMLGKEEVALVIDEFHEGIDIIQKSLEGVMANYPFYSGATLLGDGRVLLVLNTPELLACR